MQQDGRGSTGNYKRPSTFELNNFLVEWKLLHITEGKVGGSYLERAPTYLAVTQAIGSAPHYFIV